MLNNSYIKSSDRHHFLQRGGLQREENKAFLKKKSILTPSDANMYLLRLILLVQTYLHLNEHVGRQ